MTIIAILRDTGTNGNNMPIMRLQTTAFLQDVSSPGWITTQQPALDAIAGGKFEWDDNDLVLVETIDPVTGDPGSRTFFFLSPDQTTLLAIPPIMPNLQGVTAHAGGGQVNATKINIGINVVTTVVTIHDSLMLPVDVLDQTVVVYNDGDNDLDVYPIVGDYMNGVQNDSFSVPINHAVMFVGTSVDDWSSFGT